MKEERRSLIKLSVLPEEPMIERLPMQKVVNSLDKRLESFRTSLIRL